MIKMIAISEKARINIRIMSMQLCEQNVQKTAPRDGFARGCVFCECIGRPWVIGVPECFTRGCVFGLCADGLMRTRP